jgi:transcriptional adapter 3
MTVTRATAKKTEHASQTGADFTIPPTVSLLPMRPPIPPLPTPGPSKPTEVMEDFSKSKQPAQTPVSTFYTSIEPYLRPIREEDIGFLEHTGDEVEPYVMPKLGRHYLDVWAEQDAAALGATLPAGAGQIRDAPPDVFAPPTPKWDPSTLGEADLSTEARGHGPLTERVLSALLPMTDATVWKGVKAAEDAMEGRPGGSGAAAARQEKMNVSALEARIRDTMRYHGLLDMPVRRVLFGISPCLTKCLGCSPITRRRWTTRLRLRCGMLSASCARWWRRTRRARRV